MAVKVKFEIGVGDEAVRWESKLKEFNGFNVLRELKRSGTFAGTGRGPDIMLNGDKGEGSVWLRGQTWMGRFKVVPDVQT